MATSDISRKHTPGPWNFQVSPCGHSGNIFHLAVTTAYHVGTFTSGSKRDVGTFLDNARLIAAAPDLLEALTLHVLPFLSRFPQHPSGNDCEFSDAGKVADIVRAAIAKARRWV